MKNMVTLKLPCSSPTTIIDLCIICSDTPRPIILSMCKQCWVAVHEACFSKLCQMDRICFYSYWSDFILVEYWYDKIVLCWKEIWKKKRVSYLYRFHCLRKNGSQWKGYVGNFSTYLMLSLTMIIAISSQSVGLHLHCFAKNRNWFSHILVSFAFLSQWQRFTCWITLLTFLVILDHTLTKKLKPYSHATFLKQMCCLFLKYFQNRLVLCWFLHKFCHSTSVIRHTNHKSCVKPLIDHAAKSISTSLGRSGTFHLKKKCLTSMGAASFWVVQLVSTCKMHFWLNPKIITIYDQIIVQEMLKFFFFSFRILQAAQKTWAKMNIA